MWEKIKPQFIHRSTQNISVSKRMKKNLKNSTILIPKGNWHCRRKSSARGPKFKVSSEGLSTEIDILIRSPIQVQTEADVA